MLASLLLALALPTPSFAQAAAPAPSLDALELGPGVWMLRPNSPVGNSTVVAVLDGSRAALLDFGMASTADVLKDWLTAHGVKEVVFAASSHHHPDHTDGLASLSQWTKPVFATTARQYERLWPAATSPVPWPGLKALGLPILTLKNTLGFHLGPHVIQAESPSAGRSHTDGDLIFDIDNGAYIYAGDHFFTDRYPVVDEDGGARLAGYLRTIDCVVASSRDDTVIIPGHGTFEPAPVRASTRGDLRAWRERLLESIQEITDLKAAGHNLEAAQAKGLSERLQFLVERPRFVRESIWIETVYRALETGQNLSAGCSDRPDPQ